QDRGLASPRLLRFVRNDNEGMSLREAERRSNLALSTLIQRTIANLLHDCRQLHDLSFAERLSRHGAAAPRVGGPARRRFAAAADLCAARTRRDDRGDAWR